MFPIQTLAEVSAWWMALFQNVVKSTITPKLSKQHKTKHLDIKHVISILTLIFFILIICLSQMIFLYIYSNIVCHAASQALANC